MKKQRWPREALVFEDISSWKLGIFEFVDFVVGGRFSGQMWGLVENGQKGIWSVDQALPLTPAARAMLAIAKASR